MVNLGGKLVSIDETFSVPRLNSKFCTRMTGSEIASHNAAAEPLNIVCIESGSGFTIGHFYIIDESGIIHDVFTPHGHTSTGTGGTYYEIKRANYMNLIELDMSTNIYAAAFVKKERSTGTGGIPDGLILDEVDDTANTKYVKIITAGTNASTIGTEDVTNALAGGGRLSFGSPITLELKYAVSNNTSINYRMGCGQPLIELNVGLTSQMGFEGCTGSNTLNRVFSADGNVWSGENMADMSNAVPLGLRIDFYPSSKIVATDGEGNVVTKTSNLPPPGTATNSNATFRAGVKQLAPSAVRWLKIYALRLTGNSHDSIAGVKGWAPYEP